METRQRKRKSEAHDAAGRFLDILFDSIYYWKMEQRNEKNVTYICSHKMPSVVRKW